MTIHVIIGAPCSGKSTYVREQAKEGDVIIDYDAIAKSLGAKDHLPTGNIKECAFKARKSAIDYVLDKDCESWIIHTSPNEEQMREYEKAGAEITVMEATLEECLERAQERPAGTEEIIRQYFKGGTMKQKEFTVEIKEAGQKEEAKLVAYASTFDRVPDSYGDIVAKGAFVETLKAWQESGKNIPLLFGHRTDDPMMNLGKVTSAIEDEKGLLITADFDMENPNAVKARRDVIAGTLGKMSFAYEVLDEGPVTLENGVKANELRKLNIFEVSLVPIPANQYAVVTDVKSGDVETNEADAEEKAGRRNSAKDAGELEKIADLAGDIIEVVSGLTADNSADTEEKAQEQSEAKQACEEQIEAKADDEVEAKENENTNAEEKSAETETTMSNEIINQIGTGETKGTEIEAKSIGEHAAKAAAKIIRGERFSVSTSPFKAATDTHTVGVIGATTTYDNNLYGSRHPLDVRSIFGAETISGNALSFCVEGTAAGDFSVVEEGAQKPQMNLPYTVKTVSLSKIAGFLKESDEIVSDAKWLATAINNRGVYMLKKKEENKIIADLAATSGLQTLTTGISFDNILAAITNCQALSGFAADAIVMNPTDYNTLAKTKETGGAYILGGPAAANLMTIWGLPVVLSSEVASGTCYVGAFKQGASVVSKDGIQVEMTNSNEDDFEHNIVTVRIEERIALAVRYPLAFVKVYTAS